MPEVKDWGVANGNNYAIVQKRLAREGVDVPEDAEIRLRHDVGSDTAVDMIQCWRTGLIDLGVTEGKGWASMTHGQAAQFNQAVASGRDAEFVEGLVRATRKRR
jgi:hypothetical protein